MNNELYHYGVLGMKWGIRRYQPYPDGSQHKGVYLGEPNKNEPKLTLREKRQNRREAKAQAKEDERIQKELFEEYDRKSAEQKQRLALAVKYRNVLSEKELQDIINHIRLEQTVYELTKPPEKVHAGREFIKRVAGKSAENVATAVVTTAGKAGINVAAENMASKTDSESLRRFLEEFSSGLSSKKKK